MTAGLWMFKRTARRGNCIDLTPKRNPDHVLTPDNEDMVMRMRFDKMSPDEFRSYYRALIRARWESRRKEFLDLAHRGMTEEINFYCPCNSDVQVCHADLAAEFMNTLASKISAG